MPQNRHGQTPIQPLNVGNVVISGFRLYATHLHVYLDIASRANLWLLLAFLPIIPFPILLIYRQIEYSALWVIIPIWLLILLYCSAKYLTNSALISRLAFGELINQPEPINIARRKLMPLKWRFLQAAVFIYMIFFCIYGFIFICTFIFYLALRILKIAIGRLGNANIVSLIIGILGLFFIVLLIICVFSCFFPRFFITEVPLAVENNISAKITIRRSWNLTKGNIYRIILISLLTFVMTIPILILVQILTIAIQKNIPEKPVEFAILSNTLGYIISLVASIFTLPLWQIIKAVVYYDLRSRREWLDSQLRDRAI